MLTIKKDKIVNDPIYGFIKLEKGILFNLISHPFFQRLRRISQLGLSNLVYPGANHTRFQHAIGAMSLMEKTILQIRNKGHLISNTEVTALKICMLLHDIGHGPFSHALENSITKNISHENISLLLMKKLNKEFNQELSLAIKIFENKYKRQFLHQLVSSQLDMDRLDYLKRDSFFSGVIEGNIGTERIISMLDVVDDELVIEEKGIYSIEKFLIARRFMYWQVYLHKTVISAEHMLINILKRAKELIIKKHRIECSKELLFFLKHNITLKQLQEEKELITRFTRLDDYDIYNALKRWQTYNDFVLSSLSRMILERTLLKIEIRNNKFKTTEVEELLTHTMKKWGISKQESKYFVFTKRVSNKTYNTKKTKINILMKDGVIKDITQISNQIFNISNVSKDTNKYFLCFPKF